MLAIFMKTDPYVQIQCPVKSNFLQSSSAGTDIVKAVKDLASGVDLVARLVWYLYLYMILKRDLNTFGQN